MRTRCLQTLCFAIALGSAPANAQLWADVKEKPVDKLATGQSDFWIRTLGLDRQQAALLRAINQRYANLMQVTARVPGEDASKLEAMEALAEDQGEEMLAILTPEQRARFLQFLEKRDSLVQQRISD